MTRQQRRAAARAKATKIVNRDKKMRSEPRAVRREVARAFAKTLITNPSKES